jgi:arginyl-tRNA synthetase
MPNVQQILDDRVTAAMRAAFPDAADTPAIVVTAQNPKFGDYQANGAMALAKRLKKKPRDVAAAVLAHLDVSNLCETPEIAGPGFINLRLSPDFVSRELGRINPPDAATGEDRLGVDRAAKPETVVVDYSAPNLAKEMHVGHLRSTIIGDALGRMLDFAGHKVNRQNHVGDWGTQFGMLLAFLLQREAVHSIDHGDAEYQLADLEQFYQQAKKWFDSDPNARLMSGDVVVRLQSGDPDTVARWQRFRRVSLDHSRSVYKRLGTLLTDDDIRGESFYNPWLKEIVDQLWAKGMLEESEGAQCVFLKSQISNLKSEIGDLKSAIRNPQSAIPKPLFVAKDGTPLPLIVQKSDEGYLYATTDLAAIRYRVRELKANRVLYVVDARQSLHFAMVFECARQAGFAPPGVALQHIAFGTMMGSDGRPFKTREGGTVKLMDLLDEAEKRALDLVTRKNADDVAAGRAQPLSDEEKRGIAHKVGIGAVKYADLSQNRTSDYVFSWEKMLSLDGNTAPYMQYAYARVRSIFRKGGHEAEDHRADAAPIPLGTPQELALAKAVLRFPETLERALEDYRPNILAAYLYDLAGAFTAFYDACPVIQSQEPTRSNRLKLCDLTARVIQMGLGLLGIETAERM